MGRGRRPNLALEPTRALQTQRAFRQRKAEHLASLEQTVRSLSQENASLRQQLSLPPVERCLSPFSSPKGTPAVPEGARAGEEACAKCTAAAAEVQELRQSLDGLKGVLEFHGIAVSEQGGGAARKGKRFKVDHCQDGEVGVNMTNQYFTSAAAGGSPSEQLARRPPPLPSAAVSGWHTPSPSISAQTPPQGFSPRAHQAYSSYTSPVDEAYRRPPPPPPPARSASASGTRGHLPPPSPARYWSATSASGSTSPGVRPHALPAYASPSYGRRYDEQQQPVPAQAYQESPRSRMVALQDDARYAKRSCARGGGESAEKSSCAPPSSSASNGSGETKSCCDTSNTSAAPGSEGDPKWSAPPPLGVSFDMRATGTPGKEDVTSTITPIGAAEVKLDELKEDECCFGLVKCDSEGRIVI